VLIILIHDTCRLVVCLLKVSCTMFGPLIQITFNIRHVCYINARRAVSWHYILQLVSNSLLFKSLNIFYHITRNTQQDRTCLELKLQAYIIIHPVSCTTFTHFEIITSNVIIMIIINIILMTFLFSHHVLSLKIIRGLNCVKQQLTFLRGDLSAVSFMYWTTEYLHNKLTVLILFILVCHTS
jgi:hypothetical protein